MGIYINPREGSKEAWLVNNGLQVPSAEFAKSATDWKTLFPVCIVNNGLFSAAGVCPHEREFEAFTLAEDRRPKKWFMVHIDKLTDEVLGEVYAKHMKEISDGNGRVRESSAD